MISAQNALLSAIYTRLSSDGDLTGLIGTNGISDRLLPRPKLPGITFGECTSRDYSTDATSGAEHLLTIEIWSDAQGRKELNAIAERVRMLLHDAQLEPDDAVLVNLQHRSTRIRRVMKTGYFRAEALFRAVTERS